MLAAVAAVTGGRMARTPVPVHVAPTGRTGPSAADTYAGLGHTLREPRQQTNRCAGQSHRSSSKMKKVLYIVFPGMSKSKADLPRFASQPTAGSPV